MSFSNMLKVFAIEILYYIGHHSNVFKVGSLQLKLCMSSVIFTYS